MTKKLNTFMSFFFALILSFTLSAQNGDSHTLQIALDYFKSQKEVFNLTEADVNTFRVSNHYTSKHNGVSHVFLHQQVQDLDILGAVANVNVLPDGNVLNLGSRFVSNAAGRVNITTPAITPEAAIKSVVETIGISVSKSPELDRKENDQSFVFKHDGIAMAPIKVNLFFQEYGTEVRLVWRVDWYELDGLNDWRVSIDAVNGEMLTFYDNIIHCNWSSEHSECPEHIHHKHSVEKSFSAKKQTLTPTPPVLTDEETYHVFPMPVETPYHGNREYVTKPADPVASPFGWHDTDGVDGHEYTITRGNNVHAYHDILNRNYSAGQEPDGGDSLIFDFPYDDANVHPYTQLDAATTNLFYWNNIVHDVLYHYGFDEVSGNFQENNYGNGGLGNDAVAAEALDGSFVNNANFNTQVDGVTSRMQMFLWREGLSVNDLSTLRYSAEVTEPANVAGKYSIGFADFGPSIFDQTVSAQLVQVQDSGGPSPNDGCENITNEAELTGNVALMDKGLCDYGFQIWRAQLKGAIAAIVCNDSDVASDIPFDPFGASVTIPAYQFSKSDCDTLKTALADGIMITIDTTAAQIWPLPGAEGRDSDFDNMVIAHEYGHGISIRLTGGPDQGRECLFGPVGGPGAKTGSEGWSDFFGLVLTTTEDMSGEMPRPVGNYSDEQAIDGPGIRLYPYSTDFAVNPHVYGDLFSISQTHAVGTIWCTILWDMYWAFVDVYGFDSDMYHGTGGNNMALQLVVDGLKLQPCTPTFRDSRDAILAADVANFNGENQCLIWEVFARRGLGWGAGPDDEANGFESYELSPNCSPTIKMKFTGTETVFRTENITYNLELRHDIPGTEVDIDFIDEVPAETDFVPGSNNCTGDLNNDIFTIPFAAMQPGILNECSYDMQTSWTLYSTLEFEDDFEGNNGANWQKTSPLGGDIFLPNGNNPHTGNTALKANNSDVPTEQLAIQKDAIMVEGDAPGLVFWHDYDTQNEHDGAVIEITTDDGDTWQDLGQYMVFNGYNGLLMPGTANPLAGQLAFTGNSEGYVRTIVDLTDFKGMEIKIRFRFGTDEGGAKDGWYIDDIQFYDHVSYIINEACIEASTGDMICEEVLTLVLGDETNTQNILPDSFVDIFPNPTTGQLNLEWSEEISEVVSVRLLTLEGRELAAWNPESHVNKYSVNIEKFGKGLFLVQIQTADKFLTKKVGVH